MSLFAIAISMSTQCQQNVTLMSMHRIVIALHMYSVCGYVDMSDESTRRWCVSSPTAWCQGRGCRWMDHSRRRRPTLTDRHTHSLTGLLYSDEFYVVQGPGNLSFPLDSVTLGTSRHSCYDRWRPMSPPFRVVHWHLTLAVSGHSESAVSLPSVVWFR